MTTPAPEPAGATVTSTPVQLGVKPRPRPRPGEQCDLCGEPVPDDHRHVVNLRSRALLCSCRACYLLFTSSGAGGGLMRAVPDRFEAVPRLSLDTATWDALQVPVGVVFFVYSSLAGHVSAFYPGPAGAAESLLPLSAWGEILAAHPVLDDVMPDVEAVLIRGDEAFVVPIDACYELVGLLRVHWRGFDGGEESHRALDDFFAGVRERARVAAP